MYDRIANAAALLTNRPYDRLRPDGSEPYVPPAWDMWYKMALGVLIKDRGWIETALRDILELSAEEWRLSPHRLRVEPHALCEITALIKDIDQHRRAGAWSAPLLVIHPDCTTSIQCKEGWDFIWTDVLGGQMLHPRRPISDAEILLSLKSSSFTEVCAQCTIATYEKLQAKAAYRMEEYYFRRCVCNILGQTPPGKQTVAIAGDI
jgi:hypothetical protein